MKTLLTIMTIFLLFGAGCYNDNEENIYQYYSISTHTSGCDTAVVTYEKPMKLFFDNKCNSCHTTNSICNFNTYSNAKDYATQNGTKLYNTVQGGMHQGVTLNPCEKGQLKKWIANPAP